MKKKIFSLFMILFMCTCKVTDVYADAATITIAGGAIATGGLSGAAVGTAIAPYVVPIILGVMVAGGMNVYLTEESKKAGMTKTEFLKSKIRSYCDSAGVHIDNFWNSFADNVSIAENGAIYLGSKARTQIKQLINYLQSNNEISSGQSLDWTGETVLINGQSVPLLGAGDSISIFPGYSISISSVSNSEKVGILIKKITAYQGQFFLFQQSNEPISVQITMPDYSGIQYLSSVYNNFYHAWNTFDVSFELPGSINSSIPFIETTFDEFVADVPAMDNPDNDTFTGTADNVGNTTGALSPSAGDTTVYQPDLTSGIDFTGLGQVTADLRDYLDALRDILDGVQNPGIDVTDDITGERIRIGVDDAVIDPSIGYEHEQDVPDDTTPVNDDKPADPEITPEATQAPLKFDIKGIFPFCIPFDIKNMLTKLSADPVAPVYTVNWHIPIVNQDLNFTVDLTPFNDVAAIARKMELLALVVGLAIITRSLIRG